MTKVLQNSQGKVYVSNGKALLSPASGGDKYGANINTFLGDIDSNGVLQLPTKQSDLVFTGVKDVASYGLSYRFPFTNVKTVSFPALTTVSGSDALQYAFFDCTSLTSVDLSSLTTVSESNGFRYAFNGCTSLTSVDLSSLTTVSGSYGFYYAFNGCMGLTSVDLSALTTVSGSIAFSNAFQSCIRLTSVDLPALTTVSESSEFKNAFAGCTSLTDIYFRALTTSSFGSYKNQFQNMMLNTGTTTTHTLHFPSNMESTISGLQGYPLFGGTSGYVVLAYDLPATE